MLCLSDTKSNSTPFPLQKDNINGYTKCGTYIIIQHYSAIKRIKNSGTCYHIDKDIENIM